MAGGAVDPWRNVFVADTGNSRIQKFHRDFRYGRNDAVARPIFAEHL